MATHAVKGEVIIITFILPTILNKKHINIYYKGDILT